MMAIDFPGSVSADLARPLKLRTLAQFFSKNLAGAEIFCKDSVFELELKRVAVDSRYVDASTVFVALKGEKLDGHSFIPALLDAGACVFLVSKTWLNTMEDQVRLWVNEKNCCFLSCSSPLEALQAWAAWYRASLAGLLRIGITGSNGKTSTKTLLASILSQSHRCFMSPGNMNSIIGLPLAILAIPEDTEIAVLEMGMDEKGEMDQLVQMIFPNLAIITNIGLAHIGNIGSQTGIAEEKKKIFSKMNAKDFAFIPEDDAWKDLLAEGVQAQVVYFGETSCPGYTGWEIGSKGQTLLWKGHRIAYALSGDHNRKNALACLTLAQVLEISEADIITGIESLQALEGRGEVLEGGRCLVCNEAYNANPDSMKATIKAFMERPLEGRRFLVLGDMMALGEESFKAHAQLGQYVAEQNPDYVFFVGSLMQEAAEAFKASQKAKVPGELSTQSFYYNSKEEAASLLASLVSEKDAVFIKASRSQGFEFFLEALGYINSAPAALKEVPHV